MASSSKKKTTFAKLNREQKVREKRQIKDARRAARKLEASLPQPSAADEQPEDERTETA
jgi:hypothetical protein